MIKHPIRKSSLEDNSIHISSIPSGLTHNDFSKTKDCSWNTQSGLAKKEGSFLDNSLKSSTIPTINSNPMTNPKNYHYKRTNQQELTYKKKIYPVNKTNNNRFGVLQQL